MNEEDLTVKRRLKWLIKNCSVDEAVERIFEVLNKSYGEGYDAGINVANGRGSIFNPYRELDRERGKK